MAFEKIRATISRWMEERAIENQKRVFAEYAMPKRDRCENCEYLFHEIAPGQVAQYIYDHVQETRGPGEYVLCRYDVNRRVQNKLIGDIHSVDVGSCPYESRPREFIDFLSFYSGK